MDNKIMQMIYLILYLHSLLSINMFINILLTADTFYIINSFNFNFNSFFVECKDHRIQLQQQTLFKLIQQIPKLTLKSVVTNNSLYL